MATIAEIKAALDDISQKIAEATAQRAQAKARLLAARNLLAGIATTYADVIATINGWSPPTGAFQELADNEKDLLQTEFTALKTAIETELTAIGVSF